MHSYIDTQLDSGLLCWQGKGIHKFARTLPPSCLNFPEIQISPLSLSTVFVLKLSEHALWYVAVILHGLHTGKHAFREYGN